jgi:hypothetical protein
VWTIVVSQPNSLQQIEKYADSIKPTFFDMIDYVLLPSPRKRAITQQPTCLLGSFEGCEEQRYQYQSRNNSNQKSSGGWRSQRRIKKSKDYLITGIFAAPSNVPLHMKQE